MHGFITLSDGTVVQKEFVFLEMPKHNNLLTAGVDPVPPTTSIDSDNLCECSSDNADVMSTRGSGVSGKGTSGVWKKAY